MNFKESLEYLYNPGYELSVKNSDWKMIFVSEENRKYVKITSKNDNEQQK